MALNKQEIAFMLGFSVTGDFGFSSWYTRADGSKVVFPKYVLDGKRKTPARMAQRQKWIDAGIAWQLLTTEQKQNWQAAVTKLSLPVTGYNVFLWHQISANDEVIKTIEHQSGINLIS